MGQHVICNNNYALFTYISNADNFNLILLFFFTSIGCKLFNLADKIRCYY